MFADKPILVPLTTSLYVPGTLADPENVIVDVGTGFYVEKVRGRKRLGQI
jgi:prefoldin alpha subunit